jgi:acyl carrier protein
VKSKDEIFELISRILVEHFDFDTDQIVSEALIVEDLDLDSLDTMDLAIQLEEETGVDLDVDQIKSVQRLGDIVDIIQQGIGPESA